MPNPRHDPIITARIIFSAVFIFPNEKDKQPASGDRSLGYFQGFTGGLSGCPAPTGWISFLKCYGLGHLSILL